MCLTCGREGRSLGGGARLPAASPSRGAHRVRLDLEPHDPAARKGVRAVVLDDEAEMVVDVRLGGLGAGDVLGAEEAEPEATVVHVLLRPVRHLGDHLRRRRQVVHDQVDAVVLPHALREGDLLRLGELDAAGDPELGAAHEDLVRRILDHGAVQHLAQVLCLLD